METETLQKMVRRLDKSFAEGPEATIAVLKEIAESYGRDTADAAR
jgi:hypothetical protein